MAEEPELRSDSSFRSGVRAAIQAAVNDLAELVKRRDRAGGNEMITGSIRSIAQRLATLPVPSREDDALPPVPREVLLARTARILRPDLSWDSVAAFAPEGFFVDDQGKAVDTTDEMRIAWAAADQLVALIRYA